MTTRLIFHLDLDAFFCAVEEQHRPDLIGQPFAVGGQADARGVVAACSYAARQFGVHSALPMATARQRCPALIVVPARHGVYGAVSRQVMALLGALTPLVEPLSIDEAFLDVTGIPDAGETLARRLQTQIAEELNLPASLGVASNKLVAKIANNQGKSRHRGITPPRAIEVVPPGEEAAYLAPLDVRELWGVGPKTAQRLQQLGVNTIGDLAAQEPRKLEALFGKIGRDLAQRAQGIDERPVVTEHEARSISQETTFARDIHDAETLRRTLRQLSEGVGRRLRRQGLHGGTVKIKLRWSDFTTITRQHTLKQAIDQDEAIYRAALHLFERHWPAGRPVRLLGVGLSGLSEQQQQLSLFDAADERRARHLQTALDDLRERFGGDVIQRGSDFDD